MAMNAHEKAKLLGLLFWLYTLFNVVLVIAIAIIYVVIMGIVFSQAPQRPGDPPPELIMTILVVIFVVAAVFTFLFSIPKLVAGYGLRKNKPWAWTWTLVASIMACMSFPLGTGIGIFGLLLLFSEEGKRYFNDPAYRAELSGNVVNPPVGSWREPIGEGIRND